jgi:hypothetical protein
MTTSTWIPETLTSVTLTEGTWGTIRTALICLAADAQLQGHDSDAAHWMAAFNALKEAMGD